LTPLVTSSLDSTWTLDVVDNYGWDGRVCRYELNRELPADALAEAIQVATEALKPAPISIVIAELTRLRMLTASRDQSTNDLEFLFAIYADELKQFPCDAIKTVLREWPRRNRFWPTVAEIIQLLEPIVEPRNALLDAFRRGYQKPKTHPDWFPPDIDEKQAVQKIIESAGVSHAKYVDKSDRDSYEAVTQKQLDAVKSETKYFRLAPPDDPRVTHMIAEMHA
jgi:hypothetical protein